MEKDKKSSNDYLEQFIGESTNSNENVSNNDDMFSEIKDIKKEITGTDLNYINIDLSALPLGIFYKNGFMIKIRSAKVSEVQAYSVVDDQNFLDVTEKMNQLISSCVRVELPSGKKGSYKDIKDGDRLSIIFMIRELTFQSGNSLAKEVTCNHCQNEFSIPFRATSNGKFPKTFESHEMDENLKKYYNEYDKVFEFKIGDGVFKLAPPTIGIQEVFYEDIKTKVNEKKTPNVSFLKIIPFLLHDRINISAEGIKAKELEFKRYDMKTFQVLNHAVDLMVFGLKGLKYECSECGMEVHTDMTFPNGASSLFVISNPFDYIT